MNYPYRQPAFRLLASLILGLIPLMTWGQCSDEKQTKAVLSGPSDGQVSGCIVSKDAPYFEVEFENASTNVQGNTRFTVDFGDGTELYKLGTGKDALKTFSHRFSLSCLADLDSATLDSETSFPVPNIGYVVRLIAIDQCNNEADSTGADFGPISVYEPPSAEITVAQKEYCLPAEGGSVEVEITHIPRPNFCSSSFTDYIINWGDGNSSKGDYDHNQTEVIDQDQTLSFSHDYTTAGEYDIIFEAKDLGNNACGSAFDTVSVVIKESPTAAFSDNIDVAGDNCINNEIEFSSDSDGENLAYTWEVSPSEEVVFTNGQNSESASIKFGDPGEYEVKLIVSNSCGEDIATQMVTIKSPPNVTLSPIDDYCSGLTVTPSASFNAAGGAIGSYAWSFGEKATPSSSNSDTPPAISYASPGEYSISVTASNECGVSQKATQSFTVKPVPTADITVEGGANCEGKEISFNASNSSIAAPGNIQNYEWSFGKTTEQASHTFDTIGSATIDLIVTSDKNCSNTTSKTLEINPLPIASFTTEDVCQGTETTFQNSSSIIGNGTLSYSWDFQADNTEDSKEKDPSFEYGTSEIFNPTLTVTSDKGCTAETSQEVEVFANPEAQIDGTDGVCENGQEPYNSQAEADEYTWAITGGTLDSNTDKEVQATWNISGTGSIKLTTTNIYNSSIRCTNENSLQVNVRPNPAPAISAGEDVCQGSEATYSTAASSNNFAWSVDGGTITQGETSNEVTVKWETEGTHTLQVEETVGSTSCSATASIEVNVIASPSPSINLDQAACAESTLSYTYSSPNSLSWKVTEGTIQGSDTGNSITVIWGTEETGEISLTETNPDQCSTTITESVTINPNPSPNIEGLDGVCEDDQGVSYSVTEQEGHSYSWSVGNGGIDGDFQESSIKANWGSAGEGFVAVSEVIDATKCRAADSLLVNINPLPDPTITAPAGPICSGQSYTYTVEETAGNQYEWSIAGGEIIGSKSSNEVEVRWDNSGNGTLSITETVGSGSDCQSSAEITVTINPTPTLNLKGDSAVCGGTQESLYELETDVGETYNWQLEGAGSILGESNLQNININWDEVGFNGNEASITASVSTSAGCSNQKVLAVKVNYTPNPTLEGDQEACVAATLEYNSISQASSNIYTWSATSGEVVPNDESSNRATITWLAPGEQEVVLTETLEAGGISCAGSDRLSVQVNPNPSPVISGRQEICAGTEGEAYSTPDIPDRTYQWEVTSGEIIGDAGASSITINWANSDNAETAVSAMITLTETNTLTNCDTTIEYPITLFPNPNPTIDGETTLCSGDTQKSYRIDPKSGHSYNWSILGGSILEGEATPQISVEWGGEGTGQVIVQQTSDKGCAASDTSNITINEVPSPAIVAQDTPVCAGQNAYIYKTEQVVGNSYSWAITNGNITNGTGTSEITVAWESAGNATLTLTESISSSKCATTVDTTLTVNPSPNPKIQGATAVCANDQDLPYNIVESNNGSSYQWEVSGGSIQGEEENAASINVNWGSPGEVQVSVIETIEATGCQVKEQQAVIIRPNPEPSIAGDETSCAYQEGLEYKTEAIDGNEYLWQAEGGLIEAGQASALSKITWQAPGTAKLYLIETAPYDNVSCSVSDTFSVAIDPNPQTQISGPSQVCAQDQGVAYQASNNEGESYLWRVSQGEIMGDSTQAEVVINWGGSKAGGTPFTGTVTLSQTNNNTGCDTLIVKNVAVEPNPNPEITGLAVVCAQALEQYSIKRENNRSYQWQVQGGSIVEGENDNRVEVQWNSSGNGLLVVLDSNTQTQCYTYDTLEVNINPIPTPAIQPLSPDSICSEKPGYEYKTSFVSGNSYSWIIDNGSFLSAKNQDSVSLQWGVPGQGRLIVVEEIGGSKCKASDTLQLKINPSPSPDIVGDSILCENQQLEYEALGDNAHQYLWSQEGGTFLSDSTLKRVQIQWEPASTAALRVVSTDPETTCAITDELPIILHENPTPKIDGDLIACEQEIFSYRASSSSSGHEYSWAAENASIVGNSNQSQASVRWGDLGAGSVYLTETIPYADGTRCSIQDTLSARINPLPTPNLQGPSSVCAYDSDVIYSTTDFSDHTFEWEISNNEFQAGDLPSSITVSWGEARLDTITLFETIDSSGCQVEVVYPVAINPNPEPVISGSTVVCESAAVTYRILSPQSNHQYEWTVTGGDITGDSSGESIEVNWEGEENSPGIVEVVATNTQTTCNTSAAVEVFINPIPSPSIVGSEGPICAFQGDYAYSTEPVAGNRYQWDIQGGSLLTDTTGGRRNSILVAWGEAGPGTLTVTESIASTGCGNQDILQVSIQEIPDTTITGSAEVCAYREEAYGAGAQGAGYEYDWSVEGGEILSGQGQSDITIRWHGAGSDNTNAEGIIKLEILDSGTGCIVNGTKQVSIQPNPKPVITGALTVCEGDTQVAYKVEAVDNHTYQWAVSGNAQILGNTTAAEVQVNWGNNASGTLTLTQANSLTGCDTTVEVSITINPLPSPSFVAEDICLGSEAFFDAKPSSANGDATLLEYEWDLGNGETAEGLTTSYNYPNPDIYQVTLNVTDSKGCQSDVSQDITVFDAPQPRFNANTVCFGQKTLFNDASSPSQSPPGKEIVSWSWEFGDDANNTSSDQNPAYLYAVADSFNVTLTIVDEFGCSSSTSDTVVVLPLPKPDFEFDKACFGESIAFSDASTFTIGQITQWEWNFGEEDARTSKQNPSHLYQSPGSYPVKLITTDEFGCQDSVSKQANVTPLPQVGFQVDTVCVGTPSSFDDLSEAIVIGAVPNVTLDTWHWDFGDGNNDTIRDAATGNTTHIYEASGIYTAQLVLKDSEGCTDSLSRNLLVFPSPIARFEVDSVCQGIPSSFTDLSVPDPNKPGANEIISWVWELGDGSRVSISAPDEPSIQHPYDTAGNYIAELTVRDANNCSSNYIDTAVVHPLPQMAFEFEDPFCIEEELPIQNNTTGEIASYWDFDDGSPIDSLGDVPVVFHVYSDTGFYDIQSIAETEFACLDSLSKAIEIIQPPTAEFSIHPLDTGCAPLIVDFENLSTGKYVTYFWDFGNGDTSTLREPPIISFEQGVITDTVYRISLTVANKCDTVTYMDSVTVFPHPAANFGNTVDNTCTPARMEFLNATRGRPQGDTLAFYWNMGNGNSYQLRQYEQEHPPTQWYYAEGEPQEYEIELVAVNKCGIDTFSKKITVYPDTVTAGMASDLTEGCAPLTVNFQDQSVFTSFISYSFGDGSSQVGRDVSHTFLQGGVYEVRQVVTNGCVYDTATIQVTVHSQPELGFSLSADTLCFGQTLEVTNTSSALQDALWDMGDGSGSFSDLSERFQYTYPKAGTQTIKLIGFSPEFGCPDTLSKPVFVSTQPVASFEMEPQEGCQPLQVAFDNTSAGSEFQRWRFGDGNVSIERSPKHTYTVADTFVVSLLSLNEFNNCPNEVYDTLIVHPKPEATLELSSEFSCETPVSIDFNCPTGGIASYEWDFGNGEASTEQGGTLTYDSLGHYPITLIATTPQGCADTAQFTFKAVPQPIAAFQIPSDSAAGCQPFQVFFDNQSQYANAFLWDFGDGSLSNEPSPTHIYREAGEFDMTLTASNQDLCFDDTTLSAITVHPKPVAAFGYELVSEDNYLGIKEFFGKVAFINETPDAVGGWWIIESDTFYVESADTLYQYRYSGWDTVTLATISPFGCLDTLTQELEIPFFKGLVVPTAFTPNNGFGEHTVFKPKGTGLIDYEIRVYDKWGVEVWRSSALENGEPSESWNGIHQDTGQPLPQGSYVWKVIMAKFGDNTRWEGQSIGGRNSSRTGTVTIIR